MPRRSARSRPRSGCRPRQYASPYTPPGNGVRRGEPPGPAAVGRAGDVVGEGVGRGDVAAAEDPVERVAERHAGRRPRSGPLHDRRPVGPPRVTAVAGGQDPGLGPRRRWRSSRGRSPDVAVQVPLAANAPSPVCAGGSRSPMSVQVDAVGGAHHGEAAGHRVAHGEAAARVPEGEAVVERAGVAVGELERPGARRRPRSCRCGTGRRDRRPADRRPGRSPPSTSRNSRLSAPGTTPLRQVSPPSVVTT